jgi:hypothetical protein
LGVRARPLARGRGAVLAPSAVLLLARLRDRGFAFVVDFAFDFALDFVLVPDFVRFFGVDPGVVARLADEPDGVCLRAR